MSTYYVQSGTLRTVVSAESSGKAAIWAIHQTMQQIFPLDQDAASTCSGRDDRPAKLDANVTVSAIGFDSGDAKSMPTLEVVSQWNQMVTTLDRLEKMLHRAA